MPPKKITPKAESEYRNRVSSRRISITVEGSGDDGGAPTLVEFLKQLEAVKVALKHTERLVSGAEEPDVYFKIVGLSMDSPATVVLEETPIKVDGKKRRLALDRPKKSSFRNSCANCRRRCVTQL